MTTPNGPPRKGAFGRLQERMQQDRIRALYGDSPPPNRQPSPYPDGEILYECNSRFVVRHGDYVTKYTKNPHGMGANDVPNEAVALEFVKSHTTIPVPEVVSSDWDRITMTYIEGQTLKEAWPDLTAQERSDILRQLSDYMEQMRSLGGIYIGRIDGQGVLVPSIMPRSGGPFRTTMELQDWLVHPPIRVQAQSMYWHQITSQLGVDRAIHFTHGDIAARNILVRNGHIVAILDWEFSGSYPAYWEYVFALRGLDNVDWDSLGQHLPSLFSHRYDLEYILLHFILRIS